MKIRTNSRAWLAAACVILAIGLTFATGCGPSGPRQYDISGEVTYDGKPIHQGTMIFEPLDKKLGAEGGTIKDGHFTGKAKEGKNKVRITAVEIGPNTRYIQGVPVVSNFLPERYNDRTELEIEVTSDQRAFDFELKSK